MKMKKQCATLTFFIGLHGYTIAEDNPKNISLSVITVPGHHERQPDRSIITQNEIDQKQSDNVADLVNTVPGVSMAGGFRPSGQTLNIRGMGDTEDIRVQVDGTTKNFEKYQQGSLFIEPELLRRVSIDKGNHYPQYGNGGFAGTIKLETKNAKDFLQENQLLGGLLKYGYNTNNNQRTFSGAIFMQNDQKNIDALVYATVRRAHDYKRADKTPIKYSANNQANFLAKVNWWLTPSQLLAFSKVHGNHNGWEPFAAKRDLLPGPTEAEITKYGLDLAWKRKLVAREQQDRSYSLQYQFLPENNPWINTVAQLSHSSTAQHDTRPEEASKLFSASLGNESWTRYTDLTFDVNNTSLFNVAKTSHTLLVGLQWVKHKRQTLIFDPSKIKNAEYNHGYFQPYYMPSGRQYTHAFYAQDKIKIHNLTVSIGTRYDYVKNIGNPNIATIYNDPAAGHDYSSKHYPGWSSYLGLNYKLTPYLNLFSNISNTWRAPVIDEQYETQYAKATSSPTASSLDLKKERITQLRVGKQIHFDHILSNNDQLSFNSTFFYYKGKDEIFKTRGIRCFESAQGAKNDVCSKKIGNYRNLPGYQIKGFELEANYDSTYWFTNLSYSHTIGKRLASPRNPWLASTSWIAEIPPRKAVVTLGSHIPDTNLTLGWKSEFVRRQDRSPTDQDKEASHWALPKSSGYALHGIFATWQPKQIKHLRIQFTVDNLLNRSYRPYLSELAAGTGRNIKLSISKQF
ncbi:TonB-dependent hemoglobin/transferrin/lactoferrin family receptor [[Haemophilus] ducreyi]|uniref:TonB-dependent hemoglobin/transferrin/lactoferrin family receptor n=1 Tax=Haemophilus ducreyi TaxID=730 RepID=UPI000654D6B8|nr:TonB-dependent hemoglobin/transferrin/lactoferrin family receptor [[Haemophilus] ducreyi]AKO44975.1 TonB-dependent receptor [[Haemophilus] ducreyi]AKO46377.1 TonB-dependent receptor [[Haemophilus] ducreyi]AKO47723.1 TonB-dependent receptor [[Haemophilus] ducreyi]AKO49105.1 TonB-dependent receptor [[Haemophilus] ducreyi]OOS03056.1 TonB-dependent receptor [[Haemophilus] ducreyi]